MNLKIKDVRRAESCEAEMPGEWTVTVEFVSMGYCVSVPLQRGKAQLLDVAIVDGPPCHVGDEESEAKDEAVIEAAIRIAEDFCKRSIVLEMKERGYEREVEWGEGFYQNKAWNQAAPVKNRRR